MCEIFTKENSNMNNTEKMVIYLKRVRIHWYGHIFLGVSHLLKETNIATKIKVIALHLLQAVTKRVIPVEKLNNSRALLIIGGKRLLSYAQILKIYYDLVWLK